MRENKLLPCPFCGSDKVDFWDTGNVLHPYQIVCLGCFNGTDECISEEVAIRRWNTRKPIERMVIRLKSVIGCELHLLRLKEKILQIIKEEGGIE